MHMQPLTSKCDMHDPRINREVLGSGPAHPLSMQLFDGLQGSMLALQLLVSVCGLFLLRFGRRVLQLVMLGCVNSRAALLLIMVCSGGSTCVPHGQPIMVGFCGGSSILQSQRGRESATELPVLSEYRQDQKGWRREEGERYRQREANTHTTQQRESGKERGKAE
jgi:hypothetical protein